MVDAETIRDRIRKRLGSPVADRTDLVDKVVGCMDRFLPGKDSFLALRTELREMFRTALCSMARRRTNKGSYYYSDNEIDEAADELIALLIEKLRVCEFFYRSIRDFYIQTGSMQASRILREKYTVFLKDGEAELLELVAKENESV